MTGMVGSSIRSLCVLVLRNAVRDVLLVDGDILEISHVPSRASGPGSTTCLHNASRDSNKILRMDQRIVASDPMDFYRSIALYFVFHSRNAVTSAREIGLVLP